MRYIIFAILCLVPITSQATPLSRRLLRVGLIYHNAGSSSFEQAAQVMLLGNSWVRDQLRVKVYLKKYKNIVNEAPGLLTPAFFSDHTLFRYWKSRYRTRRRNITILMLGLPPLLTGMPGAPGRFYGGYAETDYSRIRGGFAFINFKRSSLKQTSIIYVHELGHLLGASHDKEGDSDWSDGPFIMHPDAQRQLWDNPNRQFSLKSKQAVTRAIRRERRYLRQWRRNE